MDCPATVFTGYTLSNYSDLSQIIIALVNLGLAGYIFVYQRGRDSKANLQSSRLNEQNIKLQWFKELIIQPNYSCLIAFFSNLQSIRTMISTDNMPDEEIIAINRFINDESAKFRVNFYDIMLKVNNDIYKSIKAEVESLVTTLTTVISDDEHKLTNSKTFEREILEPIIYAKNNIVSIVFNYTGQ